jgi:hypothetical protein
LKAFWDAYSKKLKVQSPESLRRKLEENLIKLGEAFEGD